MGFLNSFFRETGKNTGKWVSNKVFGSGWSTPHRIRHEYGSADDSDLIDEDFGDAHLRELNAETRRVRNLVEETDFTNNNADAISVQLDDLITAGRNSWETNTSLGLFRPKIQSGIIRLRRLGEHELANHYQSEWNRLRTGRFFRIFMFILLALVLLGGLAVFVRLG